MNRPIRVDRFDDFIRIVLWLVGNVDVDIDISTSRYFGMSIFIGIVNGSTFN